MLLYGQLPSGSSLWWAGSFWYPTKKKIIKKKGSYKICAWHMGSAGVETTRGGKRARAHAGEERLCVCVCVPPLLHRAACLPPRGAMFITTSCFAV